MLVTWQLLTINNRHANSLVDEIEKFKGMANDMLVTTTSEAYDVAHKAMYDFLSSHPNEKSMKHWLAWWDIIIY